MEQSVIINNDEYQLFSGADFASDLDDILFSTGMLYHNQLCHTPSNSIGLQMGNEDSDKIFESLFSNDNVSEHSVIANEYFPSEFEHIFSGELYEYF
jgi:hypothetical protein